MNSSQLKIAIEHVEGLRPRTLSAVGDVGRCRHRVSRDTDSTPKERRAGYADSASSAANRSIISRAVIAASNPLLPAFVPARSMAWSSVSAVMIPNTTGHAGVERDLRHPFRHFAGNVVEVRRVPLDQAAQAHHGRVPAGAREALRGQRDLEAPRHPGHVDGVLGDAVAPEAVHGAGDQFAREEVVEPRRDDRDSAAAGVERPSNTLPIGCPLDLAILRFRDFAISRLRPPASRGPAFSAARSDLLQQVPQPVLLGPQVAPRSARSAALQGARARRPRGHGPRGRRSCAGCW